MIFKKSIFAIYFLQSMYVALPLAGARIKQPDSYLESIKKFFVKKDKAIEENEQLLQELIRIPDEVLYDFGLFCTLKSMEDVIATGVEKHFGPNRNKWPHFLCKKQPITFGGVEQGLLYTRGLGFSVTIEVNEDGSLNKDHQWFCFVTLWGTFYPIHTGGGLTNTIAQEVLSSPLVEIHSVHCHNEKQDDYYNPHNYKFTDYGCGQQQKLMVLQKIFTKMSPTFVPFIRRQKKAFNQLAFLYARNGEYGMLRKIEDELQKRDRNFPPVIAQIIASYVYAIPTPMKKESNDEKRDD